MVNALVFLVDRAGQVDGCLLASAAAVERKIWGPRGRIHPLRERFSVFEAHPFLMAVSVL